MGEPHSGVGLPNKALGSWEAGVWDYVALPKQDLDIMYDEKAQAYYGKYQSGGGICSYDTPETIQKKMSYLKQRGMGGAMFWEASGDGRGQESLVETSFRSLGSPDQTENLLVYPDSRYRNIASGMKAGVGSRGHPSGGMHIWSKVQKLRFDTKQSRSSQFGMMETRAFRSYPDHLSRCLGLENIGNLETIMLAKLQIGPS
jgi:hypothetical protein